MVFHSMSSIEEQEPEARTTGNKQAALGKRTEDPVCAPEQVWTAQPGQRGQQAVAASGGCGVGVPRTEKLQWIPKRAAPVLSWDAVEIAGPTDFMDPPGQAAGVCPRFRKSPGLPL